MASEKPYPVRLYTHEKSLIETLHETTGIPRGTLIAKLVEFALAPALREKFLKSLMPTPEELATQLRATAKVADDQVRYKMRRKKPAILAPVKANRKKKTTKKKAATKKVAAKKKAAKKKTARKKSKK